MHKNRVWAVLPAYNEAEALPPLLQAYAALRAEDLPDLRVIVVDDGSTDGTADSVESFDQDWVTLVVHERNSGLAQAMRTGFAAALEYAADDDVIVTMDADNTHKPEQIPAMLEQITYGQDVIIGSRFQSGAQMRGIPWFRRLFSWGVSVLFRTFTPIAGVRDFSCGFRAYKVHTLRKVTESWQEQFITEDGFACMTEILYKVASLPGATFSEIPMVLRYDLKPGQSKMPLAKNIRDMFRLMWRHRQHAVIPQTRILSDPAQE